VVLEVLDHLDDVSMQGHMLDDLMLLAQCPAWRLEMELLILPEKNIFAVVSGVEMRDTGICM
jgi:hypothetical protein